MRVWDIDPGYLSREDLFREHHSLHGIQKKTELHPEAARWTDHGWALSRRHELVVSELELRGYRHDTPHAGRARSGRWPRSFVDLPHRQLQLLDREYGGLCRGRLRIARSPLELWRQHKHSIMARDLGLYHRLGAAVNGHALLLPELALLIAQVMRQAPTRAGVRMAILHMWGLVPDHPLGEAELRRRSLPELLGELQRRVTYGQVHPLLQCTAVGELWAWLPGR